MPTKDGAHAYTDEEKAEIIAHVLVNVASGRFVSRIFREDDIIANGVRMPNQATFWRWIFEDDNLPEDQSEKLCEKLVRAREFGVEALIDEAIDIADISTHDTVIREDADGGTSERANSEWITRSRLRVETRLKVAAMLKPKKYGAKLDLTNSDGKLGVAAKIEAAQLRLREGMKQIEQEGEAE
jgi:hypothetical protein